MLLRTFHFDVSTALPLNSSEKLSCQPAGAGVVGSAFGSQFRAGPLTQWTRGQLVPLDVRAAAIELVAEGSDPRMMGFFSGVPYPEKGAMGGAPHLDCVFLYQRNIERACRTVEEVEEEIRTTLIHETGHFFGLSEEELEEMGLG